MSSIVNKVEILNKDIDFEDYRKNKDDDLFDIEEKTNLLIQEQNRKKNLIKQKLDEVTKKLEKAESLAKSMSNKTDIELVTKRVFYI
jgi:hypothetical protein